VTVLHDAKQLNRVEADSFGVPVSGYSLSNDAIGGYGPPSFKDAALEIGLGAQSVEIRMRYPDSD
jgi:uncharacterized protein (DUF2141 family)